ncbi:MAG TPA: disulfide bond chaperone [Opitutaceae bacterium]
MAGTEPIGTSGAIATVEYVRHRNALLVRARLTDLFLDYYLHLAFHGIQLAPEHDRLLKATISAFTLHCASRPRTEHIAWTINLQEPRLNLFAAGDNEDGNITGRVFTEHVKASPRNLLYIETVHKRDPARRSVVEFSGSDIFEAAEKFYSQSEQRPARFFDLGGEEYALLASHPDCDIPWLQRVSLEGLRELATHEIVVPMERRLYRWQCGCNEQRIFRILAPAMRQDPDELFHGEDALRMECPRCGALYRVGREALEAYVAQERS